MKVKTGLLLGAAAALVGLAGGVLHSTTATPIEGAYAVEADGSYLYDLQAEFANYNSDWDTSYTARSIDTTVFSDKELPAATIDFQKANKQTGTITDMPVSKASENVFTLTDPDAKIYAIEFGFAQWTTKQPTIVVTAGEDSLFNESKFFSGHPDGSTGQLVLPHPTNAVSFNQTTSNQVGYKYIKVWTTPVEVEASVAINATSEYVSDAIDLTSTLSATVLGVDNPTYAWTVTTGAELVNLSATDTAEVVVSGVAGAKGKATIQVAVGDLTATIDITVLVPVGIKEALADETLLNTKVILAGYIVTDNTAGGDYYTRYEIADKDISAAYKNGETTIQLYDRDRGGNEIVSKGQYVVVYGDFMKFNTTFELDSGWTLASAENNATRLADFVLGSDVTYQCNFKYEIAKAHFLGMTEEEKTTFKTSVDTTIAAARERYEAWASAVGDTNAYEATSGAFNGNFGNDGMTYTIIALGSLLAVSLAGVAVYFAIRKKKANKA